MFHVEQKIKNIETADFLLTKESFVLAESEIKGLLKTTPKPSKENLHKYYASINYASHNADRISLFSSAYRFLRSLNHCYKASFLKGLDKKKSVLDFGSGDGYFIERLSKKGYNMFGVEPIKYTAIPNVCSSLNNPKIKGKKFSVITAWHSLEHVYELNSTIQSLYDLLEPKGKIVVALPNYDSYDANYYGKYWAGYDAPRHLWHFNKSSVNKIFTELGFSPMSSYPLFLDSYYISLLSEKYRKSNFAIIRALALGSISNLRALFSKQYSSNVFVFQKN
tara:strand:- start:8126 stop:8962 length:837 start_codon:yes stop_codon:yes gene_type:complete